MRLLKVSKMSKISVVIVTYNNQNEIDNCLKSIFNKTSEVEIIIVDSDSKDDTRVLIKKYKNKVKLIELQENLGFGKACNLGVKKATGEYLIFLNPDTVILEKDFFASLATYLELNIEYGLIGPRIVNRDKTIQKSVRHLPTALGAFKEYILGQKGAYDFYQPVCQSLCEVESLVGACIVIKKDVFEKLGGFDNKYFMYFEDLELCRSIRKTGLKVGYLPNLEIEHTVGASGFGSPTLNFARKSAKKYFGLFQYYLIEIILTPRRILNKIRVSL